MVSTVTAKRIAAKDLIHVIIHHDPDADENALVSFILDNLLAAKPDPATGKPDPAALKDFAETHPDSAANDQVLRRPQSAAELREQRLFRHPYLQVYRQGQQGRLW